MCDVCEVCVTPHVGVNGGSGLHPDPPSILLPLEAVEEKALQQLVQQLLKTLTVWRRNQE